MCERSTIDNIILEGRTHARTHVHPFPWLSAINLMKLVWNANES